ncbi:surface lipoprotein assembly modifier [Kingella negevensis]|uniref:surface lipoprotein assembly modifier n=1 Tax=Kingella negevensis TaxID=1522312 RepID=UPI00254A5259|nr:surface lipoprotein assembly modifier [Kingella negevensis]MDK4697057.1 surface lipoprotein assembly modifier [Kingella negevensis]
MNTHHLFLLLLAASLSANAADDEDLPTSATAKRKENNTVETIPIAKAATPTHNDPQVFQQPFDDVNTQEEYELKPLPNLPKNDLADVQQEYELKPLPNPVKNDVIPELTQPETSQPENQQTSTQQLDDQINQALVAKKWDELEKLLAVEQQAGQDETLRAYAKGALLRQKQEYPQAIAEYRKVVAAQPELGYPRLDLGIMLFENKQFREAKAELTEAKARINPEARAQKIVDAYLEGMEKEQSWQPNMGLQYTQTDNVNNASDSVELFYNGRRFVKDTDALPKSAHGFNYNLGLEKDTNLAGNHYARVSINGSGVHYWDNSDYDENSLQLSAGYRYQSWRYQLGFTPFFAQNWLGGERYNQRFGVTSNYRYRFNPKWSISAAHTYFNTRYRSDNVAKYYNGYNNNVGLTLMWNPTPRWLLFGGVNASHDKLKDKAESSKRAGFTSGVVYDNQKWGARTNFNFANRRFQDAHFLYGSHRADKEYQISAAVWHHKLTWHGITPRLNYRYLKIDSNMPALYSRKNGEWFISAEKTFH